MDTLGLALVIAARPGLDHCRSALPAAPVVAGHAGRPRGAMADWWLRAFARTGG